MEQDASTGELQRTASSDVTANYVQVTMPRLLTASQRITYYILENAGVKDSAVVSIESKSERIREVKRV